MSRAVRTFWAFGSGYNGGAMIEQVPEDFETHLLMQGKPVAGTVPADAAAFFSKGFRKEIKVFDSMANTFEIPIVSSRIKAILEHVAKGECEFIPITIFDHKRKMASKEHFFLNTLRVVDFVDMGRSKYELSNLQPDQIDWLKELHVLRENVGPDVHIFRAKTLMTQVFIDEAIHRAFEDEGITGLRLFPAEGWDGDTM